MQLPTEPGFDWSAFVKFWSSSVVPLLSSVISLVSVIIAASSLRRSALTDKRNRRVTVFNKLVAERALKEIPEFTELAEGSLETLLPDLCKAVDANQTIGFANQSRGDTNTRWNALIKPVESRLVQCVRAWGNAALLRDIEAAFTSWKDGVSSAIFAVDGQDVAAHIDAIRNALFSGQAEVLRILVQFDLDGDSPRQVPTENQGRIGQGTKLLRQAATTFLKGPTDEK